MLGYSWSCSLLWKGSAWFYVWTAWIISEVFVTGKWAIMLFRFLSFCLLQIKQYQTSEPAKLGGIDQRWWLNRTILLSTGDFCWTPGAFSAHVWPKCGPVQTGKRDAENLTRSLKTRLSKSNIKAKIHLTEASSVNGARAETYPAKK